MDNLSDPEMLGPGIATAFVATIYGVGFANIIFIPLANKLRHHVNRLHVRREMVIEGLIEISKGEDVVYLKNKLNGFMGMGEQRHLV